MSIEELIVVLFSYDAVDCLAEVVHICVIYAIELVLAEHHWVLHLASVVERLKGLRLLNVKRLADHFLRLLPLDSFHSRPADQPLHVVW